MRHYLNDILFLIYMLNEILDSFLILPWWLQIIYPLLLIFGILLLKRGIRNAKEGKEEISMMVGFIFILTFLLLTFVFLKTIFI